MRKDEKAWAAGVFEAKGQVDIMRKGGSRQPLYALRVALRSRNEQLVGAFVAIVDPFGEVRELRPGNGRQPQYVWTATAQRAAAALGRLRTEVRSLEMIERIELAVEFQKQKTRSPDAADYHEQQQSYYERMMR